MGAPAISAASLRRALASDPLLLVSDVHECERFREAPDLIRGALRRDQLRVRAYAPAGLAVTVFA